MDGVPLRLRLETPRAQGSRGSGLAFGEVIRGPKTAETSGFYVWVLAPNKWGILETIICVIEKVTWPLGPLRTLLSFGAGG